MSAQILFSVPIAKARKWLDDASAVDWTAAELLEWANDAVAYIMSLRPDTRIAADHTEVTFTAVTNVATEYIPFANAEKWSIVIAHYIAIQGFSQDAGDERDASRAAYHQEQFDKAIAGI